MADLTITLQGGSSMPLHEVAEVIREALADFGWLSVQVERPPADSDTWDHGWDGLLEDETVLIRQDPG